MAYANPHAITQLSSGYSTGTFTYDADGNVTQKTTDGTTTTYIWDYANRLTALGVAGQGTTTYGYDAFGTRVYALGQISDQEMKLMMTDIVDRTYDFLMELCSTHGAEIIEELKQADKVPECPEPMIFRQL
jgi:YD repeat-containing protein